MAYTFNNSTPALSPNPPDPQAPAAPAGDTGSSPAPSNVPASAALVRFQSCRWMQPAEHGNAAFCTHREVKPYAGAVAFEAEAWCPDCQHYKLRRSPKKRTPEDYSY